MNNEPHYTKNGKKFSRVSTILSIVHDPGLEKFQRAKGFKYVDGVFEKKGDFGSRMHDLISLQITKGIPKKTMESLTVNQPDLSMRLINFKNKLTEVGYKILSSEKKYLNDCRDCYPYGGTIDAMAESDKGKGIIDFKSGMPLFKHHVQIGGYLSLAKMNGEKINWAELWYIGEEEVKIIEVDIPSSTIQFHCTLNIYRAMEAYNGNS